MRTQKVVKTKTTKSKRRWLTNDIFNHPLGRGSWNDFFIPHHGNDHKPHALHPKRVFFHLSVAMVIKGLVFLFVLNYPITAWMTPDVSTAEAKRIITLTNNLRASVSAGNLAENSKLNQAAYRKVQDMFLKQYFAHRSPDGLGLDYFARQGGYSGYYVIGENLAVGYDNADGVMVAWQNSPTHYKNLVDTVYRDIGVSMVGGEYKDKDTVFIAQYFGSMQAPVTSEPQPTPPAEKKSDSPTTVLSEKTSTPSKPTSTEKPKATVVVSQPAGKPQEKVVEVKAQLPATTTKANVDILDKKIALEPTAEGEWEGREVISGAPSSVAPALLTVDDASGTSSTVDIPVDSVLPASSSLFEQYSLYKNIPNEWLGKIFSLSTIYYEIMLVLAMIALALNVAVAHHKQHPHLIASGVGLIVAMFFLIII